MSLIDHWLSLILFCLYNDFKFKKKKNFHLNSAIFIKLFSNIKILYVKKGKGVCFEGIQMKKGVRFGGFQMGKGVCFEGIHSL